MRSSTQDPEYDHRERAKRKSAAGRKTVRWDPGLDQLVLLCVDYDCTKRAIGTPWNDVAKLVERYHWIRAQTCVANRSEFRIPGNNDHAAPSAKKNKMGSGGDTNKAKVSAERLKPGDSLLFKTAGSIGKKSSKSQGATTATSAANNSDDEWFRTVGNGTKRGSKYVGSIDDDESVLSTPTKRQKTSRARNLRNRPNIDYSKQLDQSEDDGDDTDEEDEAAKNYGLARQYESPVSNNRFYKELSQKFKADGIVNAPIPAQSGNEFGINTPFDGQPVNGPSGVAGFRGYNDCTNMPFPHFQTSEDFSTANYMPPLAFNNSNENPLMSGFENNNRFRGGKNYSISGAMNFGGSRATNNEIVSNRNHIKDLAVVNNGNFANGVPQIFTQKIPGGFNANAVKEGDADFYFTSFPTDMAVGNTCIPPAMTPMPTQQVVDSSKTSRIYNSHDSGSHDSQANGNDSYDHDIHLDSFVHKSAYEADHIFDNFGTGDEHSMFHPISGIH
ncbi:hypothetical protein KC316_g3419 [Hortaea werneckii]|nr:hypothetical protein KC324_g4024 [Hortaea werneckii]KAI7590364.1 hypothetical protein KC316_g3419 [Hortaea werneckii]